MNCAALASAAAHRDETDEGPAWIKTANFGFLGVIWGLGNDLTTAVGIVRITAGSVPPRKITGPWILPL